MTAAHISVPLHEPNQVQWADILKLGRTAQVRTKISIALSSATAKELHLLVTHNISCSMAAHLSPHVLHNTILKCYIHL